MKTRDLTGHASTLAGLIAARTAAIETSSLRGSSDTWCRSRLAALTALLAQLAMPPAQAAGPDYWDNLAGAGFGTAGGTWSAAGNTGIPAWGTDSSAATDPSGTITTATTDATINNNTWTSSS